MIRKAYVVRIDFSYYGTLVHPVMRQIFAKTLKLKCTLEIALCHILYYIIPLYEEDNLIMKSRYSF